MTAATDWRLAVVRIGRSLDRRAGLLVGGESVDRCVELAYYLWCIRTRNGRVVVVDAGFSDAAATSHTIIDYVPPAIALADVGVSAHDVDTVVMTHLHWDHMGGYESFPNARFVVSRAEWAWTVSRLRNGGRMLDETYDRASLESFLDLYPSRIDLVDAAYTFDADCRLSVVGGHTPGHLVVEVALAEETVALVGDLAYLYENLEFDAAPMICFDRWRTKDLYEVYRTSSVRPIPGHDPAVLDTLSHRVSSNIAISN